jgi:hypothetical protein
MALNDRFLREASAEVNFTAEEIKSASEQVQSAIFERITEHFRDSRLRSGPDYWMLDCDTPTKGVWLAFTLDQLQRELKKTDREINGELLQSVAEAYLMRFYEMGLTVRFSVQRAKTRTDPSYYPIYVSFPEEWRDSEWHTVQRFEELLLRYNMSPAEALDYWATENIGMSATDWASKRQVDPEAVRKNVRQAKKKFEPKETGATNEVNKIRAASVEEIPEEGVVDENDGLVYMPAPRVSGKGTDDIN